MDGPMPKTVLIILAAVVALIVIVVLTGMRYLRADDDDFEDDAPAEHGHARSRGHHPTRAQQARPHAGHGEEMPDERRTERVGAARAARSGAVYGGERGPDRGPDRRGAARVGQDRGWRDDSGEIPHSGEMPRGGREPAPQREQRRVRAGRGGHADVNEPVAASARSGRSQPGLGASRRPEEFDSQPGRAAASASVYERETAGGRERRDDRDRIARHEEADFGGRRESGDRRDDREIPDPRDSRDSRDRRKARPAASVREIGDHDELDRRGATGPNARTDVRKNGARSERGDLLPAVKARQGKSKRDSDGDWPTNEWDELSDVDYWAELASDKPLTTAAPSGQGSRARGRESRQDARPGPDRAEREGGSTGSELPVRQASRRERQPDQELLPPVASKPDLAASDRLAAPDQLSASDRRAAAGRPKAVTPAAARPAPADDDPLTSPSFPRIEADDSRSYRRTRAAAPEARQPASREPDALQPMRSGGHARPSVLSEPHAAYPTEPHAAYPAEPHAAYPAVPRVGSVSGLEGAGQTRSYPRPGPGGSDLEATTAGYGNTAADRASSGYPVPASYQLPAANVASYAPATGGYSGGYQAPRSYPTEGTDGYRGDTAGRGGYPSSEYPSSEFPGYRPESGSVAYPRALPGSYPPGSNSASYHDAGSYSLPAPTSGYDNGYPEQAASYQGYAGSGSSSGAYLPPEAGYQAGYPRSAEASFGGPLDGGHGDFRYPVYPAPVPAEHGAAYQAPARQLPGYPEAAQQAGPYDPAGYPAPVHETGGYEGADPYAVDPYGQNGYGGNGN
jgi:hypothetical protein